MYEKEMLIGSMQKRHLYGGEILLIEISLFSVEIGSEAPANGRINQTATNTNPIGITNDVILKPMRVIPKAIFLVSSSRHGLSNSFIGDQQGEDCEGHEP